MSLCGGRVAGLPPPRAFRPPAALGPTQATDVRRMVVAQGGRIALVGVAIGLAAALRSAHWIESLLFEIRVRDALVYAAVSVLMPGVALFGSYLLARKASAVSPLEEIRTD